MMKYVLVLLLLSASWFTGGAGPAPVPTRLQLQTSFAMSSARGIVDYLDLFVDEWPDHLKMSFQVREYDPTCGCLAQLFSGIGTTRVPSAGGDIVVARDLRWAAIHTTLPVIDDLSHSTVTWKIDLAMHATGEFHRGDGSGNLDYVNATARGVVATPLTTFVATDRVSASGMIARTAL